MQNFWTHVLAFTQSITAEVGTRLLQDYGRVRATEKNDGSLVTESDQWADREIRDAIALQFPDHGVLSEEVEHILPPTDWCWVIDPIDGTTNFTQGIPLWAISLGLLYKGTPVFGFVYLPTLNQSFHGFWSAPDRDNGAFSNSHPIQVRQDPPGSNQFFSFCARSIQYYHHPFPCKIRMLGVASYNLLTVAAGITLGAVEATPKIWDIAGVWPILQAAGASWVALDDRPIFPLTVGKNYSQQVFPTLVVARSPWIETFLPFLQNLNRS
ncbi:MAG: inositol monophosphatase [Acaryochloridaceae cyanobacterium RU_4_10]|nr:inositol monophosphatase [Acaryochloridaceae cyanobacterium RU_4_10]